MKLKFDSQNLASACCQINKGVDFICSCLCLYQRKSPKHDLHNIQISWNTNICFYPPNQNEFFHFCYIELICSPVNSTVTFLTTIFSPIFFSIRTSGSSLY